MANSSNSQGGSLTQLWFWSTALSPDAWVRLGQVAKFGPIGHDRPEENVTDLDSTGQEFRGGLPVGRSITLTLYANATTLPQIEALFDLNAQIDFKAITPAPLSATRYFSLTPLGITQLGEVTPDGTLMVELSGRMTGGRATSVASHP